MGHATAPGQWYDQDRAEWVLLLAGSAGLVFEGETEPLPLEPGSYEPPSEDWLPPSKSTVSFLRRTDGRSKGSSILLVMAAVAQG
jgi:hypothetical protein